MVNNILEGALNLYWLRPENALAITSYIIHGIDISPKKNKKYADFACGDGINTFFKSGGRFNDSFDLFLSGITDEKVKTIAEKNIDIYDAYDHSYRPLVTHRPKYDFYLGTDHKPTLLKKSKKLKFYEKLHLKDLRQEVIEVNDGSLDFIYCNSLYWVQETEVALQLMKKKLKSNGKIILDVFTTNKKNLDWGMLFPSTPNSWRTLLNRGRQKTNPGLCDEKGWEKLFSSNSLYIVQKKDILPAALAHIWNLGLRPIFPMLNKMASNLNQENRMEIKKEWVGVFKELFLPILAQPSSFSKDKTSYRLQYVLECKN